jgi:hypothetical protein
MTRGVITYLSRISLPILVEIELVAIQLLKALTTLMFCARLALDHATLAMVPPESHA